MEICLESIFFFFKKEVSMYVCLNVIYFCCQNSTVSKTQISNDYCTLHLQCFYLKTYNLHLNTCRICQKSPNVRPFQYAHKKTDVCACSLVTGWKALSLCFCSCLHKNTIWANDSFYKIVRQDGTKWHQEEQLFLHNSHIKLHCSKSTLLI